MNYSLPLFYTKNHLNLIAHLTKNSLEKVDMEDLESDYSDDYDSYAPYKEFDSEDCEDYDLETYLRRERPDNYSYYLK